MDTCIINMKTERTFLRWCHPGTRGKTPAIIRSCLLTLFICSAVVQADVTLPRIFGSKMVLQRDREIPVWGWADPGEEVTVEFAGQAKEAMPDDSGKWMVTLDPLPASAEAHTMTVRGWNEIRLEDVLVGEVWLASGQSNMELTFFEIEPVEWADAKEHRDNTLVRAFHVEHHLVAGFPMDDTLGRWKNCAEMVARPDSVSAVAFFFALKLQETLGVPVAFLDASWGGRKIEAFIPEEGYKAVGLPSPVNPRPMDMPAAARRIEEAAAAVDAVLQANLERRKIGMPAPAFVYGNAQNEIHNAMIAPLAPFALRGAIWYQGESNWDSTDYYLKLQALSAGWSEIFQVKDIPILQVQIAPNNSNGQSPPESSVLCDNVWAAQYRGARDIPGMGIVAIQDTGINPNNIHPRNKKAVGVRLAALALKTLYGHDVVDKGPGFASALRSGSKVVVTFKDIGEGLTTFDGKPPAWFELSADGSLFISAEATIIADRVEVSTAAVPEPEFVRMGWRDIAVPNLVDKNGWPVFAFPARPVMPE
jgi:sialate O-acetylesterase